MDRVGKIKLVLIVVTIDNLVCFSSVSIFFLFFIWLFVVAIFFLSTANAINKSWSLHNLRLFSCLSMYETFSWKY